MLDHYERKARLAPVVVATIPAALLVGFSFLAKELLVQGALFVLGVVGIVACSLSRDAGRRLQPALWESWGGGPAMRRLRWRGAPSQAVVERLHGRVESLVDLKLPTSDEEDADPAAADDLYEEVVAVLRERTRDRTRFRLVFLENCDYGFRRNALGLRSVALVVAYSVLVISALMLMVGSGEFDGRLARWGLPAAASVVSILFWSLVVTPDWVRRSADVYADRLYEAVDTLLQDSRRAR